MKKTLTKEELAEKLNSSEYRDDYPKELLKLAKENRLVIITGASDDIVSFAGAIDDETYACDGGEIFITKKGVPQSECDSENCPFYKRWFDHGIECGEICMLRVFWCGQCKRETMDAAKYAALGKPTWCYETTMPHASFGMFDTESDGVQEYYCRGIVLDLMEIWPAKSYEQYVLDAVVAQ